MRKDWEDQKEGSVVAHVYDFSTEVEGVESLIQDTAFAERRFTSTTWLHRSDDDGRFKAGFWQAEPCKIRCTHDVDEFCFILEGQVRLTDAREQSVTFGPGGAFCIGKGFDGLWENLTMVRKIFVIARTA